MEIHFRGKEWWKEVICNKYLKMGRIQSLDKDLYGQEIKTWDLCKVASKLIRDRLYWVPRNRKKIDIWEDKILDQLPLNKKSELNAVNDWLTGKGISNL